MMKICKQKQSLSNKKILYIIFSLFKQLFHLNKKALLLEILGGIVEKGSTILKIFLPAILVNQIVNQTPILSIFGMIVAFSTIIMLLNMIERYLVEAQSAYGYETANLFSMELGMKQMKLDYSDLENPEILSLSRNAAHSLWEFLEIDYIIIHDLFSSVLSFFCMVSILASIHIGIVGIILGLVLIGVLLKRKSLAKIHDYDTDEAEAQRQLEYITDKMQDISFGKEIRIYNAKDYLLNKYNKVQNTLLKIYTEKENIITNSERIQSIITGVETFLIYAVAVYQFAKGEISIGSFLLYAGAIRELAISVTDIFDSLIKISKTAIYYEDYQKFIQRKETIQVEKSGQFLLPNDVSSSFSLEFQHVWFRYPGSEKYVLEDINFTLNSKDVVAIVGENGGGKTTLIKLLLRLYDVSEGCILLNGKNIKDYQYKEYIKMFAPVFQDIHMHAFSIRDNITGGKLDKEKRTESLIKKVGLQKRLLKKENLDTWLSTQFDDSGIKLSGGETQKIAIARALYKDAPIVLLDEPASALDPISESEIYQQFYDLTKEKTGIYISHRMSSTQFASKIIVLDKGKIVEQGSFRELMNMNGLYYDMYQKQAIYYKETKKDL